MRLDLGSFAFGSSVITGGNTPSWGTSLGQRKPELKFTYPGYDNIIIGMLYKSIPVDKVYIPLGKGGHVCNSLEDEGIQLAALFDKVYINEIKVDAPFIMLIYQDGSDSWSGRRTLKYNVKIEYRISDESIIYNSDFVIAARNALKLDENACWVVSDIYIVNQDELHLVAGIVNPNESEEYPSADLRKAAFLKAIKTTYDEHPHFSLRYSDEKIDATNKIALTSIPADLSLQQIFYGAPGTGKSHTINRETKGHETFRTTFHPDSDYSTFVGAYKPVMEEVETRVVPVVLNNGASFDQNYGTLKEKKISYKFVKQAFLKAYIAAWRTFANTTLASTIQTTGITLTNKTENDLWILNEVTDNEVRYTKMSIVDVAKYETLVKNYWKTWCNADEPESFVPGNSDLYQATPCVWYKKKHDPNMETSAEDCWNAIIDYLKQGNHIDETPRKQLYRVTFEEGNIKIYSNANAYIDTIRNNYNEQKTALNLNSNRDSVQTNIANKMLSDYRSATTFEEAWEELKREVNTPPTLAPAKAPAKAGSISVPPVFLIVEEINRGNCAQIFGDLFQLLDRKEGFSQYPIHADQDIRKCLVSEHTDEDPSFGTNGLDFTPEQVALINQVLDCEHNVAEKIASGEVLVLPPNLYIWATMNTSDQSLFPIDSAFKRRWDWEYMPIEKGNKELVIEIGANKYDWWKFISIINSKIDEITGSEDKKLGYWFAKPVGEGTIISCNQFVSKVLFYLWNDVYKDYADDNRSIFRIQDGNNTKKVAFTEFFGSERDTKLYAFMKANGIEP